jgi:hypothetical protein
MPVSPGNLNASRRRLSTMSGVLVEVRRDGKLYPPHRRTAAEVAQLRALEHRLHCRMGLSIRKIQRAMAAEGIRRSTGMIHRDLHQYECPVCSSAPKPPDPAQKARTYAWR